MEAILTDLCILKVKWVILWGLYAARHWFSPQTVNVADQPPCISFVSTREDHRFYRVNREAFNITRKHKSEKIVSLVMQCFALQTLALRYPASH